MCFCVCVVGEGTARPAVPIERRAGGRLGPFVPADSGRKAAIGPRDGNQAGGGWQRRQSGKSRSRQTRWWGLIVLLDRRDGIKISNFIKPVARRR